MKKKDRKQPMSFKSFHTAYDINESDTIVEKYERYKNDPYRKIEIDGMIFYRIIALDLIILGEKREFYVVLDNGISFDLKVGDILIDENENRFTITSFPFDRPIFSENMDWFHMTTRIMFKGDTEMVGEYLAKWKPEQEV